MDQPVLGTRDVLQRHLDLSLDARRLPQEKMRRILAELMPPVAVAHGQGVGDGDRARRRGEGGLQHHGAVQVAASHLGGARGPDRPVAGFVTEEATEDGRAVEAWEAQPVDRPVPAHQRRAVPIREERIVGYRGRAHASSFARGSAGSYPATPGSGRRRLRYALGAPPTEPGGPATMAIHQPGPGRTSGRSCPRTSTGSRSRRSRRRRAWPSSSASPPNRARTSSGSWCPRASS